MTGGLGADVFIFNSFADTGATAATRDVITDFTTGSDKINLAAIDAIPGGADDAFNFVAGGAAITDATKGQVHAVQSGGITVIEGHLAGHTTVDFQIELTGLKTITAGDFNL
jgi:hypothetical protein